MGAPTRRVASACFVATIALGGAVVVPGVGSSQGDSAASLRRDGAVLAARERSAVLELYGLETRLTAAQTRLASLRTRSEALARSRATTARRLAIARRTVRTAQQHLALRLRTLYERGDPDPLAVVLGAESLEDALTTIDGLELAADQDRAIIEQSRAARTRFARLTATLSRRSAELGRLVRATDAEAATLARARDERAAYVARLAAERKLTAVRIARAEAAAEAARAHARSLAVTLPAPELSQAAPVVTATGARTLTVTASGYALAGPTATGVPAGWGVVAVDPAVIPLGTRLTIPGYGSGVASDTGPAIRGAAIDLWFPTTAEALAWGRRTVTITLD